MIICYDEIMANIAVVNGKQSVLNPHNLQVGDVVTAYQKGFWMITDIDRRFLSKEDVNQFKDVYKGSSAGDEYSSLVHLVKLNQKTGKKTNKIDSCDIEYCLPAKDVITKQIAELQHFLSLLP